MKLSQGLPFLKTYLSNKYSFFFFFFLLSSLSFLFSLSLSLLYFVILCYWINDATKCPIMINEQMYWHTLFVHYGTRARFLNNNISRFESAFRCNCCHRCGSLSYSTMKSIDTSYTMNPCLSKLSKFLTKQYINIL